MISYDSPIRQYFAVRAFIIGAAWLAGAYLLASFDIVRQAFLLPLYTLATVFQNEIIPDY